MLVPGERRIAEDDAREGKPVGVVHDERHVPGAGHAAEALDLFVGDHVARGVGGPRHADRADVPDIVEPVEVHPVLEQSVAEVGDGRAARDEEIRREAEVGVADVLRRERQQDAAHAPVLARSREQVEQGEERGLAAGGEGDVAFAHVEAVLAAQESRDRSREAAIALRPVVAPDRPLERPVALHERQRARPEHVLRGRNEARVSAPEVHDLAARGRHRAEVVHERARAGLAGEPLSQCGEVHRRPFAPRVRSISDRLLHHGVKLPSGFNPSHAPLPNPLEFDDKASARRDPTADMPV